MDRILAKGTRRWSQAKLEEESMQTSEGLVRDVVSISWTHHKVRNRIESTSAGFHLDLVKICCSVNNPVKEAEEGLVKPEVSWMKFGGTASGRWELRRAVLGQQEEKAQDLRLVGQRGPSQRTRKGQSTGGIGWEFLRVVN